ncbi:MAG: VCBS repeat-containing protein [Planctomycetes bacterium]|nr:VCBS repeat-containing protein [Planctomycetota bacterium]MCL4729512.1 VCBS repeat-containing protein [Planctomycetota bacterium]
MTSAPVVRLLAPADLDGDGLPDSVAHPATRRLVLQAPDNTVIRLTRAGTPVAFEAARLTVPGGTLHELTLALPLGTAPLEIEAGAYRATIMAVADLAAGTAPQIRPTGRGALANDVVAATGAVFETVDDVALALGGALPPLIGPGLYLQSGTGNAVPLLPSLTRNGVVLTPQSRLLPDRVYTLRAPEGLTDTLGNPLAPEFRLICRHGRSLAAIRMAVADMDRDGNPDLLALFADGSVTVLRDVAGPAETLLPATPGRGIDFAVGDFDGNGAPDVAVLRGDEQGFHITYLINETRRGELRFLAHTETLALEQPGAMRSADFDRDARDDLAVLDAFGTVHLLTSSNTRRTLPALGARRLAAGLCVCDADGDSKPDIVVLDADGTLRFCPGQGAAGFGTGPLEQTAGVPGALRVCTGHLDGDRVADFLFSGMDGLAALVGGLRGRIAPLRLADGEGPGPVSGVALIRDLNRDSRNDVLCAREDSGGLCDDIAVFMNGDEPRVIPDAVLPLGSRQRVHALEYWREHVMLATDARLLMLKVNAEGLPPTAASKVRFVEGYAPVPQIPAPLAACVADFNDDGRADIAAIDRDGKLRIWLSGQPGEPFLAVGEPVALGGAGTLRAIDFDRDGRPDLLFIPSEPGLRPRVLRNTSRGEMDASENGMLPQPPSGLRGAPALGDFDLDGDLDVLWPSALGRVQFNDGSAGWRDGRNVAEIREPGGMRLQFSGELACADFTGDGIADVAAVMRLSEDTTGVQYLVLLEGTGLSEDGASCFRATISEQIRGRIFKLTPADFDGDGRIDLALGYAPEGGEPRLTLLRLRPDMQFAPFEGSPRSKGRLLDLALDDLDRDGDFDLIVSEDVPGTGPTATLWVNTGRGNYVEGGAAGDSLRRALGEFKATNLSLADFTGDGRSDLLAVDANGNVILVRTELP